MWLFHRFGFKSVSHTSTRAQITPYNSYTPYAAFTISSSSPSSPAAAVSSRPPSSDAVLFVSPDPKLMTALGATPSSAVSYLRPVLTAPKHYQIYSIRDEFAAVLPAPSHPSIGADTARIDPDATTPSPSITVDLWSISLSALPTILAAAPNGVSIGNVQLADGQRVMGLIADRDICKGQQDITRFGSWSAYCAKSTLQNTPCTRRQHMLPLPSSRPLKAADRLQALRSLMQQHHIDAYIVESVDIHQSEYVSASEKRRHYLSDFDGSVGTALVTADEALLWTDSRYHTQASLQLQQPLWTLMKEGLPDTPSLEMWLKTFAKRVSGSKSIIRLGLDASRMAVAQYYQLQNALASQVEFVLIDANLVDTLWEAEGARPAEPCRPVCVHEICYTGRSTQEKLADVRSRMAETDCHYLLVTSLDEIAWLFNLRGDDIAFTPVFFSFALVTPSSATLYVDPQKINQTVQNYLASCAVSVAPYERINQDLSAIPSIPVEGILRRVWMDPAQCSVALAYTVTSTQSYFAPSPIKMLKAVKNSTEISCMQAAHRRDAVACVSFLAWLETADPSTTEITAADKLQQFRELQPLFFSLSFPTISASSANGAIVHYHPSTENPQLLDRSAFYLCDSGAQYRDGTTDVTRTIHLGRATAFERECFTRVLRGLIRLSSAVFPAHTPGPFLDALARSALWQAGMNYGHGTGHGVGSFLGVHEGPHVISMLTRKRQALQTELCAGMVTSIEPGFYLPGHFGIRIENLALVVPAKTQPAYHDAHASSASFLSFEPLTLVPIQTDLVDSSLLEPSDIEWFNAYHRRCRAEIEPLLMAQLPSQDAQRAIQWLQRATQPIPLPVHVDRPT